MNVTTQILCERVIPRSEATRNLALVMSSIRTSIEILRSLPSLRMTA